MPLMRSCAIVQPSGSSNAGGAAGLRGMEECLHLLRDVCLLHLVREDKTVRGLLVRCSECCLRSPCEDGCKNGGRKDLPNGTDLYCFIFFSQKRVTMNMQRIL